MRLVDDLLQIGAYPDANANSPANVALRETHISWVFLIGDRVFKVKKPVNFGFLDFRQLVDRRVACEAEVRLNRRLSPDVYIGVSPVVRTPAGEHRVAAIGATIAPPDTIVDWAVVMRRLPDEERLDILVGQALPTAELVTILDALAALLADFHARAASDERVRPFGEPAVIERFIRQNFDQTRHALRAHLSLEEAMSLERWQLDILRIDRRRFLNRMETTRIREGHGDLRLEHVYRDAKTGSLRVLDCIEFDDALRSGDVAGDVAFFAMDLAYSGRVDLAERFLATYAREADDYGLYPLIDFYESYRAHVRAKIASFLEQDPNADEAARKLAADSVRRHLLLALSASKKPLIGPQLIAVGGLIASGKSTLSDAISVQLGAPVVEADRTRKALLRVAPTHHVDDPAWKGAYDPKFTDVVYDALIERADAVLSSGRPVVLDASFRSVALRNKARALAEKHKAPFHFVECRPDIEVCRARVQKRERDKTASDGRLEVFDAFMAKWQPTTEIPADELVVVDTAPGVAATLASLRKVIEMWPR
jgi:hypothetical protein